MQSSVISQTYTDFNGLNALRSQARVDPESSLEQVAKQFEAIFIQMMLKSMRDASLGDEIFDSDQSNLYRDMFDKQISLDMANSKGIGIADTLVRQLSKNIPYKDIEKTELTVDKNNNVPLNGNILPRTEHKLNIQQSKSIIEVSQLKLPAANMVESKLQFKTPEEFTRHILPYAEESANKLGISPLVLVAQAALETGWGKAITRHQDGTSSFNLFNIKADSRWSGEHVIKSTLEYNDGIAKYEKASFRSYESYADSFSDYVDFLRQNNRYADALRHNGDDELFIRDLHKAGYATDPNYADKILDIFNRDYVQMHSKDGIKLKAIG